jgi:LytR cell envelope-related transcriptional attenuator
MRWRTPITLLLLLAVLLGAAYYGWNTVISPTDDKASTPNHPKPTCTKIERFKKGQRITARDVLVNVYNAGVISGLAASTLEDLKNRGFKAGVAENAPPGMFARNVKILAQNRHSPTVRLVAMQFKGRVVVTSGPALAPGIRAVDMHARTGFRLKKAVTNCVQLKPAKS